MAHERKCIVCGKEYKYCPRCREYNSNEKWRLLYCSEDCMAVNEDILHPYKSGELTKDQAKTALAKYPSVDTTKGSDYAKPQFDEIYGRKTKTEKVETTTATTTTIENK